MKITSPLPIMDYHFTIPYISTMDYNHILHEKFKHTFQMALYLPSFLAKSLHAVTASRIAPPNLQSLANLPFSSPTT